MLSKRSSAVKKACFSILCVGILAAGLAAQIQPGTLAPAFSLQDLGGRTISLADLKGKIVVLNFWATWCPPCRAEIPDFIDFYNQNRTNNLEIVGVSVDELTVQQLQPFVQKNKMTYPVALASPKIVRDYGPIDAIPTTFILDRLGRIRHTQVGLMEKKDLAAWFQKLSGEK